MPPHTYHNMLDSLSSISTLDVSYEQFLQNDSGSLLPEDQQEHSGVSYRQQQRPHSTPALDQRRSLSPAALMVSTAVDIMGNSMDIDSLIIALGDEKVNETWQLEYLDAQQWRMLGAPMGLVSVIRRLLQDSQQGYAVVDRARAATALSSRQGSVKNDDPSPSQEPQEASTSTTTTRPRSYSLGEQISMNPPSLPRRQKSNQPPTYGTSLAPAEESSSSLEEASALTWSTSLPPAEALQGPPLQPKRLSSASASKMSSITMSSLSLNCESNHHVPVVLEEEEEEET